MHPVSPFSLQLAEGLFFWSNVSYVVGALLTLASAGLVLYAQRAKSAAFPLPSFVRTEAAVFLPACISLLGAVGAIYFSSVVLNLERASLGRIRVQPAMLLSRADGARTPAARSSSAGLDFETQSSGPMPVPKPEPEPEPTLLLETARPTASSETTLGSARSAAPAGHAAIPNGGTAADSGARPPSLFDQAAAPRALDTGPASATALHSYGGLRAKIEAADADPEAAALADHLLVVLLANGIDARHGSARSVLHQLSGQPGVHIRYLDPNRGHDLAAALAILLRRNALAVDVAPYWELAVGTPKSAAGPTEPEQLLVSVGPKP